MAGGLRMSRGHMPELGQRALELVVMRIGSLPGENAWEGEVRQVLEDRLMEVRPRVRVRRHGIHRRPETTSTGIVRLLATSGTRAPILPRPPVLGGTELHSSLRFLGPGVCQVMYRHSDSLSFLR